MSSQKEETVDNLEAFWESHQSPVSPPKSLGAPSFLIIILTQLCVMGSHMQPPQTRKAMVQCSEVIVRLTQHGVDYSHL